MREGVRVHVDIQFYFSKSCCNVRRSKGANLKKQKKKKKNKKKKKKKKNQRKTKKKDGEKCMIL